MGIKHATTGTGTKVTNTVWSEDHTIDGDVVPDADDSYDLGSSTAEWQDLYIDGTANIDSAVINSLEAYGNATNRGVTLCWPSDPSTALALTNQNSNTAWADLDLTAYTSSSAKIALIQARIQVDTVQDGTYLRVELRKNATTPTNYPIFNVNRNEELATYNFYHTMIVGLDSGQVCEYQITSDDWTNGQADFSFVVLAYWE